MMTENTNTFKNSSKRIMRRGFTLIEILIVVVILGVLAALVIPGVVSALDDANTNAASARASQITTMVTRYNAFNPTTKIALDSTVVYKAVDGSGPLLPLVTIGYCTEKDLINQNDNTKFWKYETETNKFIPAP